MPEDYKVFDVSRPSHVPAAQAAAPQPQSPMTPSQPAMPPAQPVSIPVTFSGSAPSTPAPRPAVQPAPASTPAPQPAAPTSIDTPAPEAASIPVAQAPAQPAYSQAVGENSAGTVTPALPGAPAPLDNFPKFGQLQPKIDAHPLFSGKKEDRVKIRHRWPRVMWTGAGVIVFAALAFLFINSSAGASYLPFHIFGKQADTNVPTIAPVKIVTTPVTTAPVSLVPDTYAGWNTNCVSALKACVRYPSDWVANQYGGYENPGQTQYAALTVESVKDKSTANAQVVSIDDLSTPNPNLKIVGLIVGTRPSYAVYDASYISANKLTAGVTASILIGNYTFSAANTNTGMASFVGTPDTKGDAAITSIDQARAWFVSADAQQVLKVLRSFYYQ